MPFTDRQVAALRPKSTRFERPEPGRTGLAVRVTPDGTKSWTFRYRCGGEQRRIVFGTFPRMGVADAHVKLADAKAKLAADQDPGALLTEARQQERVAQEAALTIEALAQEYIARRAAKMRPRSRKEIARLLNREIVPVWRKRLAQDITRRDVMALVNAIEDRGAPVLRNRTAGVLNRLFSYALDQGFVEASPASNIRRLPEQARVRFLSKDEIRSFWHGLEKVPITPVLRTALKWALVTGQRRAEIVTTRRDEIDDTARLWRLSAERTKPGREHYVPLPDLALQVLADADRARVRPEPRKQRAARPAYDPTPSPWLFPSRTYGTSITPDALDQVLSRYRHKLGIGDATVHDLRRTFATWCAEIGIAPDILSALLNHAPKSVTEQVYNHATLLEPKRQATQKWGAWLEKVIAGEAVQENVIPIARARRAQ